MFDLMATETQGLLIGGGDLNVRLNPKLDATGSNPIHNKSLILRLKGPMREMGLIDVWREMNPEARDDTHYSSPHLVYQGWTTC